MRILICDDDQQIIDKISEYLSKISKKRKLLFDIKSCTSGNNIYSECIKYDIAFIDIKMPGIDGLTITKHIKNSNPNSIIFIVSSFQSYLDDAMALNVFRYLSKPIDEKRFMKNMNIAIEMYQKSTQKIVTETNDECFAIFTKDILYITLEKRKASIITKDKKLLTKDSFNYWKQELAKYDYFAQSHYSYIVNLKNVTRFSRTDIILTTNDKDYQIVPISRRFYVSFKEAFYNYIGRSV